MKTSTANTRFYTRLAILLYLYDKSQADVALFARTSKASISRLVSGETTKPNKALLRRVADFFNTDKAFDPQSLLERVDRLALLSMVENVKGY